MKPVSERKTVADFFPEGYEPQDNQRDFAQGVLNYRRAGIDIETIEQTEYGRAAKVKITQARLVNGYILNQKELVERARALFQHLGDEPKIIPVVYSLDVHEIDVPWIEARMEEFGIKRGDLIKQLAIDKSSLSLILSGNRELSKPMRALFYYYFLSYQLNRDLREQLESK